MYIFLHFLLYYKTVSETHVIVVTLKKLKYLLFSTLTSYTDSSVQATGYFIGRFDNNGNRAQKSFKKFK